MARNVAALSPRLDGGRTGTRQRSRQASLSDLADVRRVRIGARRGGAVPLGLVLLVAVACSTSGSTPSPAESASRSTARMSMASTSSTVESTTPSLPAPTTSATSSAPSATGSLFTTTEPADPEAEVRAALERGFNDFSACLVAMPECDPSILEATRAGQLLERNIERIIEWNEQGYTVRDRDQYGFVIEAIDLNEEATQATVIVCFADGSRLVLPGAAPDGGDVIVDDAFLSARERWDMRLDPDGAWRAYDATPVDDSSETDLCADG